MENLYGIYTGKGTHIFPVFSYFMAMCQENTAGQNDRSARDLAPKLQQRPVDSLQHNETEPHKIR